MQPTYKSERHKFRQFRDKQRGDEEEEEYYKPTLVPIMAAALVAVFTSSYHCHSVDEHEFTKAI